MIPNLAITKNTAALLSRIYQLCSTALLAVLISSAVATLTHASDGGGDVLSLLDVPMGETRDAVLPQAQSQWGVAATCTMMRTGVGLNKRAYFLETCTFDNTRSNSLYDETPASAHYYFLEGRLVQIAYTFEQVDNLKKMRRCARKDRKKLDSSQHAPDALKQSISVADDGRTVVFNADLVPEIHVLSGTPTKK